MLYCKMFRLTGRELTTSWFTDYLATTWAMATSSSCGTNNTCVFLSQCLVWCRSWNALIFFYCVWTVSDTFPLQEYIGPTWRPILHFFQKYLPMYWIVISMKWRSIVLKASFHWLFKCCNAKRFPSLGANSRPVDPKSTTHPTKLFDQHAHALDIEQLMVNLTFQLDLENFSTWPKPTICPRN